MLRGSPPRVACVFALFVADWGVLFLLIADDVCGFFLDLDASPNTMQCALNGAALVRVLCCAGAVLVVV